MPRRGTPGTRKPAGRDPMPPKGLRDRLVLAAPAAKGKVQRSVVGEFEATCQEEGESQGRALNGRPGHQRAGSLTETADEPGEGDGASALSGRDDRDHERLARRNVHLRQ